MRATAPRRRSLNPVTQLRADAQDEIDRLKTMLGEADTAMKDLEAEREMLKAQCNQLNGELQDALRSKLAQADQIETLLKQVDVHSKDAVRMREAIGTFMTNVNADVRVLMGAIK